MMNTMTAPSPTAEEIVFSDYNTDGFFDEMFDDRGCRGLRRRCWPAA